MAKKRATSIARRRAVKAEKPHDATRKMSETIVDFGRPLIAQIESGASQETVQHLFQVIIIIWNAHVRATPAWGHPESLQTLREIAADEKQSELMRYAIGALAMRRLRFRNDLRAVGDWAVAYESATRELKFSCTGILPPSAGESEPQPETERNPNKKS